MLSFIDARQKVLEVAGSMAGTPGRETIDLSRACARVLAEPVVTDRDYPPFDRSTRDGFAVRSADTAQPGATLRRIGEVKAGSAFAGAVEPGQCIQIMTGAPVPAGADAVVMIEYTKANGDRVTLERAAERGQNIVPRGKEAPAGQGLLKPGIRLGFAEMALAGQVGHHRVSVYARPRVAILSTGDEVVDIAETPGPYQVRNSNSLAVATLVELAGGEAVVLGNAPDEKNELRRRIERGLNADALVLSGGVSMGKYDLVEGVLAELGAEFFFDAVAMRPGRPAVFGRCRGIPVFGLPGNPVSTMMTFELFVIPAIDLLGGTTARPLPLFRARLAHEVRERGQVAHFLPARVEGSGGELQVSTLPWQGSGDTVAVAQANAFLLVPADKLEWAAGEWAAVLPRRGPGGVFF
jgi:molybdopterin molybdotransferase